MQLPRFSVNVLVLLILLGSSCRLEEDVDPPPQQVAEPSIPAAAASPNGLSGTLRAVRVIPDGTKAGVAFNVQSNGESAISLITENASRESVISMGGERLETTFGDPSLLTAYVPGHLYDRAGELEVLVVDGSRESDRLLFEVTP